MRHAGGCLLTFLLVTFAVPAVAVSVDGRLDPAYGPALSTQSVQTSLGDMPPAFPPLTQPLMSFGS
jgi:hypothetical protein